MDDVAYVSIPGPWSTGSSVIGELVTYLGGPYVVTAADYSVSSKSLVLTLSKSLTEAEQAAAVATRAAVFAGTERKRCYSLTDEQRTAICLSTEHQHIIAAKFGVSRSTVNRIKRKGL